MSRGSSSPTTASGAPRPAAARACAASPIAWRRSAVIWRSTARPARARHCARLSPHSLAEDRAGDHEPLDLARALVDLGDLGVAVIALGRELLRVAVTAEDLDRLAGLAAGDGRGEELGLRTLDRVQAPRVLEASGAPGQRPGRLDLGLHVGELGLDLAEA